MRAERRTSRSHACRKRTSALLVLAAALLQCIANKDIVDGALGVAGLMPLSGSDLRCVDNACGGTTGCANNVAPIFQSDGSL